jgi:hypothetical protein
MAHLSKYKDSVMETGTTRCEGWRYFPNDFLLITILKYLGQKFLAYKQGEAEVNIKFKVMILLIIRLL